MLIIACADEFIRVGLGIGLSIWSDVDVDGIQSTDRFGEFIWVGFWMDVNWDLSSADLDGDGIHSADVLFNEFTWAGFCTDEDEFKGSKFSTEVDNSVEISVSSLELFTKYVACKIKIKYN